MKTEISRFCEDCLHILTDLRPALHEAAEHMEQDPEMVRPLASLNDIRARLRSLTDKLATQQAYLLIFGPLKSGKSTLMNAISGSYVSEVTSLPGYPCLVFVQHSQEPHFAVTRYNGRESVFADGRVLKDVIADSHVALAEQIRVTEQNGMQFDPRQHFTEAVRRVDVKVPVPALGESSSVLVDTPGLYSRMNFGYDVLTREFKNSAACAVFVVKTDNLYLEQVFAEFNQLLDLFSRIFLVINVDSGKRDLQPDGTLAPSTESTDPQQIVETFKTLSMAGPIRRAHEQGRLRIHAIDLMNAASSLLKAAANPGTNGDSAHRAPFDAFMADLAEYLNSSDYTREFIRDSLRQSHQLCDETRAIFNSDAVANLRSHHERLGQEIAHWNERIATLDRLLAVNWTATLETARQTNVARAKDAAKQKVGAIKTSIQTACDKWFDTPDSIKALEENYWNPVLRSAATELTGETRERLLAMLQTPLGGAEPQAAAMVDLHNIGLDLGAIARIAMDALAETRSTELYTVTVDPTAVPVRKSFGDWLAFRSAASVTKRVLGADGRNALPPEVKQKRLPVASRSVLLAGMDKAVEEKFPALPTRFADRVMEAYSTKFVSLITEGLRTRREQAEREVADRQAPFNLGRRIHDCLQALDEQASKISGNVLRLAEQENAGPLTAEPPAQPIPNGTHAPIPVPGAPQLAAVS